MSGSGKGLLGVWLYRRGDNWAIKEGSPIHKSSDVCCFLLVISNWRDVFNYHFHEIIKVYVNAKPTTVKSSFLKFRI